MNLTAEQIARKGCEELYDPDRIKVKVRTSWRDGICIPDQDGICEEYAVFATMTFGDNQIISKATTKDVEIGEKMYGEPVTVSVTEMGEYRRLILKRNLLAWSLDIPIERDESGWMTETCYKRVGNVSAPLISAFLDEFEKSMEISDTEENKINRQCAILFSRNGHGVNDACEAVSQFCTLGNFSEKFGMDREKLLNLSYRDFLLLKIMIAKESDALRSQQSTKTGGGGGNTQIVGPGGSRASRGIRIPMPGSN